MESMALGRPPLRGQRGLMMVARKEIPLPTSSSSAAGTGRGLRASSPMGRRRALQMIGNDVEVEVEIRTFAGSGRLTLLAVTGRFEFDDAPGHAENLKRYRARGYAVKGNGIAIRFDRVPARRARAGPSWTGHRSSRTRWRTIPSAAEPRPDLVHSHQYAYASDPRIT